MAIGGDDQNTGDRKPLIRFEAVSKRFGAVTAVETLTLEIAQGEFFALLGPSGCGKTTLLRMLAGFETPSEGRIFLDGEDIVPVPPHRRPVNMMFQSYALFPHLTVEGNIAFGLRQEDVGREEIAARVAGDARSRPAAGLRRAQDSTSCRAASASAWRLPAP